MTTTINYTLYYSRSGKPFMTIATLIQNNHGHIFHEDYNTIAPENRYELEKMWKNFRNFRNEESNVMREMWQELTGFKTWSITKVWEG